MKKSLLVSLALWPAVACAQEGAWETQFAFFLGNDLFGSDAIPAVDLIHVFDGTSGKVLVESHLCDDGVPNCPTERVRLWTPPLPGAFPGSFVSVTNPDNIMFCTGHSALADGRVFHAGGFYTRRADLFHPTRLPPSTASWDNPSPPDMTYRRWYPTCTTLPSGQVLVCSGDQTANGPRATTPELYNPGTNSFDLLTNATRTQVLYPYMFVLPDGNVVDAGYEECRILKTSSWTWGTNPIEPPNFPPQQPTAPGSYGSAVMYEPGKIMRCGGHDPAVKTTWTIDLNNADLNFPPAGSSQRT